MGSIIDVSKCCGNEEAHDSNMRSKQTMAKSDYYLKNGKTMDSDNLLQPGQSADGWSSGYDDEDIDSYTLITPTHLDKRSSNLVTPVTLNRMTSLEVREREMVAEMAHLSTMHSTSSNMTPTPADYNVEK
eukprot:249097_1